MKPPRDINLTPGNAKGILVELLNRNASFDSEHGPIAEGSFWTYNPRDLRRLSAWCLKAADWLEWAKKERP